MSALRGKSDIMVTPAEVRKWQILLQKSVLIAVGRCTRATRLDPQARRSYATFTLRSTQSMNGWWPSDQGCEPPQILCDGSQNKFILGASWATQSQPTKLQDALQVGEPHLDLPAATARSPRYWRATGQRPGRAHGCRAGSCAMALLDSTAV